VFLGSRARLVHTWQPHHYMWADCLGSVGSSHNPMATRAWYRDSFTLLLFTSPLAVGWRAAAQQSWVPHSLVREWKSWLKLMTLVGGDGLRDIQPVNGAHATMSAVLSGMGTTSSQRIKQSTATRAAGRWLMPTYSMNAFKNLWEPPTKQYYFDCQFSGN
jgi:hypothetical protein